MRAVVWQDFRKGSGGKREEVRQESRTQDSNPDERPSDIGVRQKVSTRLHNESGQKLHRFSGICAVCPGLRQLAEFGRQILPDAGGGAAETAGRGLIRAIGPWGQQRKAGDLNCQAARGGSVCRAVGGGFIQDPRQRTPVDFREIRPLFREN